MERDICTLLADQTASDTLQLDDVHAASMAKSFDYRVRFLLRYGAGRIYCCSGWAVTLSCLVHA